MRQIQPRRAEFEKIVANDQQSFHWHHLVCKQFTAPYHSHPQDELSHICRGRGSRLVSDSIKHFGPGDLVFIAPNVPHIWQVSPECPEAETLYIQFLPEFLGAEFFKTPEMQAVWELMITARNGATFSVGVREEIAARLKKFPTLNPSERLLELIAILLRLSQSPGIRSLGKDINRARLNQREEERISRAFKYLNENLTGLISQAEIARSVRLSSSAFSRLFKKTTGKCFMQVVNDLRIAQVCRLLAETDRTVAEIAYGCGFETLSHFNCQFRRIMKTVPSNYRHKLATIALGKLRA